MRHLYLHLLRLALSTSLTACSPTLWSGATESPQAVNVRIIGLNDFHGHLLAGDDMLNPLYLGKGEGEYIPVGDVSRMAALVGQLRTDADHSIVVAAGDLIGGSPPESGFFHDEPAIEALTELGLQYSSVGNHEFDEGWAELQRMQDGGCHAEEEHNAGTCIADRFQGAGFQYLAANVIELETGQPIFPATAIHPINHEGETLQVGFIGAVVQNTPHMVSPDGVKGLRFTDEADAANARVAELQAAGAEAIILLIHEGAQTDKNYDAEGCPGLSGAILRIMERLDPAIDVIVSGHTHRAYTCNIDGRLLTSAGSYARILTQIDLQLDSKSGDVTHAVARNLPVVADHAPVPAGYRALAGDPRVEKLLQPYLQLAETRINTAVGTIAGEFTRKLESNGQSTMGLLIANAQLAATRDLGAQIALMNRGGMRTDLRANTNPHRVSYGQLFSAQPFGNTLVVVELSGRELRTILEEQFRGDWPKLLQASEGLAYRWDSNRAKGQRIRDLSIDGKAVQADQTYRVTVNSFLASGGDGFSVFKKTPQFESGIADVDALADFIRRQSPSPRIHPDIHRLNSKD